MFSTDFTGQNSSHAYVLKINNSIVPITNKWYWKKDFLESSMSTYCWYLHNDKKVYLDDFLTQKVADNQQLQRLREALTPGKLSEMKWLDWYAKFCGFAIAAGDRVELVDYSVSIENGTVSIIDSTILFSQTKP